jgi:hypothetical protein
MNVEIGAEATQFLEKEYINGIAVSVVATTWTTIRLLSKIPYIGVDTSS